MGKLKEDLHIFILKYGRDKLESGATFDGLCEHIKSHGYNVSIERLATYFWGNYEAFDNKDRPINSGPDSFKNGVKFSLTVEATFRLIEYEEFKSANRSSKIATNFATAALAVSIIAACFSIYFSRLQLAGSVSLNEEQMVRIINLKYNDSDINSKINELIGQQKVTTQELIKVGGVLSKLEKDLTKTSADCPKLLRYAPQLRATADVGVIIP